MKMWRTKLIKFQNIHYLPYLKWIVVGVFVLLVAVQSGKSFVLDELDFPIVSQATSQSGKPIYYRGEQFQQHLGLYHPTLYINALASFVKTFGFNETSVRFFGILCVLASAYLLVLILRQFTKKSEGLEVLFLALYLLNPYTISNATLPDIDSTVLPVLLLLFIYVSLKYLHQLKRIDNTVVILLASLFTLTLWSKLTTPLIIPPFLACLAVITTKDYRKSLIFTIKVSVFGFAAFVVTYLLYCIILGLSPTYTYVFLLESFTKGTSSEGPIAGVINNLGNIRHFIYWPTLPVVILLGISSLGILLDKTEDEKTKIKKLLISTSLLITAFYIALISPFGGYFKYPFPVFGLLLLSIVMFFDRYFPKHKIQPLYAIGAFICGFILEKIYWGDSMFLTQKPFSHIFVLLLVVIFCFVILTKVKAKKISGNILLLFIIFSIGFQLSISRIQALAPYPTKYLYGQTGLEESVSYLRANTKPDEAIWSMKDVGYYVNNIYYESYTYYFDKSLQKDLIKMLQEGKVRYYVATTGIGQDNIDYYKDIKMILEEYATKDRQYGNFVIYKAKE